MLLDMSQILSGAVDMLPFSYTMSAQRIPYSEEMKETLPGEDSPASGEDSPALIESGASLLKEPDMIGDCMPLIFDDVTVTAPVVVRGTVVNRAGYMVLTETADISYRTRCARCLADVTEHRTFRVEKTVADEKGLFHIEDRENDDYVQIRDGKLDLDAPICDEILLSFPMRILCRADCKGLCAGCGANLNEEDCRCTKKEIDPRFAALAALLETMPDDDGSVETDINIETDKSVETDENVDTDGGNA